MQVETSYLSVEKYSDRQQRLVRRLMESLTKSDSRLSEHYSHKRTHQRQRCHNVVLLRIPRPNDTPIELSAYMRDISAGGTSFVYPGDLEMRTIIVGIPIPGKETSWFEGEVVRCKQIMDEEFWDYGVRFRERIA